MNIVYQIDDIKKLIKDDLLNRGIAVPKDDGAIGVVEDLQAGTFTAFNATITHDPMRATMIDTLNRIS
jgi:hypothetical protein